MPIKKSLLEGKIYYRIAKVFFSILPLLVAIVAVVLNFKSLSPLFTKDFAAFLEKNTLYIVYGVMAIIVYYVGGNAIWRGFLYVAFGGLIDDTVKKQADNAVAGRMSSKDKNEISSLIALLILLGCIFYAYFIYQSPAPIHIINDNPNIPINYKPVPKCVPTGCGTAWRCTGSYYDSGTQLRIDSCFPTGATPNKIYSSWSGTCRQCP